jgi:acyl-homoserine lactone synthase
MESAMIITLRGSDRKDRSDLFDQLFRLRHDIFVKGRGWSLPCGNGRETDQYDVDDAVYFIDINNDGVIEGSVRATPTERYSLLADYFPHLIENGMPARAPDVYECTRYIVMPAQKNRDNIRAAKARLLIALFRWAMEQNLAYLQTVIDAGTLSSFVEMSLKTIPLGLAHPYGGGRGAPGGGECLAIRWPVCPEVITDVLEFVGWSKTPEDTYDPAVVRASSPELQLM